MRNRASASLAIEMLRINKNKARVHGPNKFGTLGIFATKGPQNLRIPHGL